MRFVTHYFTNAETEGVVYIQAMMYFILLFILEFWYCSMLHIKEFGVGLDLVLSTFYGISR